MSVRPDPVPIELVGGPLDGYREGVRELTPNRWYPARKNSLCPHPARSVEYRRELRAADDGSVVYRWVPPTEAPGPPHQGPL